MDNYYIVVNKDRMAAGNKRAYLIRGGGMVSDSFWWSYKPHALVFTDDTINDKLVVDFLKNYNIEIHRVDKTELSFFRNFY